MLRRLWEARSHAPGVEFPGALAMRRLRRDRAARASAVLFMLLLAAFLAAPLYAELVAGTTPRRTT